MSEPRQGRKKTSSRNERFLPPLRGLTTFMIADPGRRAIALALGYYLVAPSGL